VLRKNFFSSEQIEKIVKDFRTAGLPDEEVAIMAFAQKVVSHAHEIQAEDIEGLRVLGLEEPEILDIILAASARSFFAQSLDAGGVQPDEAYLDHVGDLIPVLSVGRPYTKPGADTPGESP
jgi:alkylhydroperoxidase family enzyme